MDCQDRLWILEAEGYRSCEICNELKVTKFIHDVCEDCHNYDKSQCELCYPRSVK